MISNRGEAERFFRRIRNEMRTRKDESGDMNNNLYANLHHQLANFFVDFDDKTEDEIKVEVDEMLEDYWDLMINEKTRPKRTTDNVRKLYPPGFWNSDINNTYLGIGLDGISEMELLRGIGTTFHLYKEIPNIVKWKPGYFDQGGVRSFIGSAEVREIDAVSSVPTMPPMNSSELSEWVLKVNKGKEWMKKKL